MRWLLLLALLVTRFAFAQQTVFYGPDQMQKILLYPAPGPGPHPVMVFVHGGAWIKGVPRGGAFVAPAANAAGWTLASVGYRLVPDVPVETSIEDVVDGISYLNRNAASLGLDMRRMAISGHSSGGHVAALLAADPSWLRQAGINPAALRVAVLLDGVYDVETNLTQYPSPAGRHDVFGQDRGRWRKLSPTSYVADPRGKPLFCVAHENTDARLAEQASIFIGTLKQHGEQVRDLAVPDYSHVQVLRQASDPPLGDFIARCLRAG